MKQKYYYTEIDMNAGIQFTTRHIQHQITRFIITKVKKNTIRYKRQNETLMQNGKSIFSILDIITKPRIFEEHKWICVARES